MKIVVKGYKLNKKGILLFALVNFIVVGVVAVVAFNLVNLTYNKVKLAIYTTEYNGSSCIVDTNLNNLDYCNKLRNTIEYIKGN